MSVSNAIAMTFGSNPRGHAPLIPTFVHVPSLD
jgi:hypothetical protein